MQRLCAVVSALTCNHLLRASCTHVFVLPVQHTHMYTHIHISVGSPPHLIRISSLVAESQLYIPSALQFQRSCVCMHVSMYTFVNTHTYMQIHTHICIITWWAYYAGVMCCNPSDRIYMHIIMQTYTHTCVRLISYWLLCTQLLCIAVPAFMCMSNPLSRASWAAFLRYDTRSSMYI